MAAWSLGAVAFEDGLIEDGLGWHQEADRMLGRENDFRSWTVLLAHRQVAVFELGSTTASPTLSSGHVMHLRCSATRIVGVSCPCRGGLAHSPWPHGPGRGPFKPVLAPG